MKPELTLCYVNAERIGYGRLGINVAKALKASGVDVFDDLRPPPDKARFGDQVKVNEDGHRHKVTNSVCWISVPSHCPGWREGQHPTLWTMWEATVLPETFREALHNFERVIVPSLHNVELFSDFHDNVVYCPLGVDPDVWHYEARPEPGPFFNFMCAGSGIRKGPDVAAEAFAKAFPNPNAMDGPIPMLTLKLPKGEGDWSTGENVQVASGYIPAADEAALYSQMHCYVQPSRGEGFGLQPLQAIAKGIPTILTDAHGHEAFSDLGWPVSATLEEAAAFIYGDAGQWWEPSVDEVVDHMRWIYDHYDEACAKARANAAVVAETFTWADVAAHFIEIMGDELTTPFSGDPDVWIDPEYKKYEVVTTRTFQADVAGVQYRWEPGTTYHEPADVKRLLFEAGVLDPECLNDGGLTVKQTELIGAYTAAKAYCESCGQRLNSVPTRADDMLDEMNAELEPAS